MNYSSIRKPVLIGGYLLILAIGIAFTYSNYEPEQSIPHYFLTQLTLDQNSGSSSGVDPSTLIAHYPGLTPQDFQSVSANGGKYVLQGNTLSFIADKNKPNQSDSRAVNETGAQLLLRNLSKRTNKAATTTEEVDVLIKTIEQALPVAVKKAMIVEGEYVCIPPKPAFSDETSCEQGIKTTDDSYYALDLAPLETIATLTTGNQIRAEGELVPVETLSSDKWQKYTIKGIFRAVTIENL